MEDYKIGDIVQIKTVEEVFNEYKICVDIISFLSLFQGAICKIIAIDKRISDTYYRLELLDFGPLSSESKKYNSFGKYYVSKFLTYQWRRRDIKHYNIGTIDESAFVDFISCLKEETTDE